MNEFTGKRKMAFPVAAITAIVYLALFMLYRVLTAVGMNEDILNLLLNVHVIMRSVAWIFMIAVLFLHQRKFLMITPFGILILLDIINIIENLRFDGIDEWDLRYIIIPDLLEMVVLALLIIFVVSRDWNVMPGALSVFQKLWFIPGIVIFIEELSYINWRHIVVTKMTIIYYLLHASYIVTITLLGWWLTHSYDQQPYNPGFDGMPPQGQPYPQRMQGVNRPTQQKAFCTGCGKELQPNENFCIRCGTKRPN